MKEKEKDLENEETTIEKYYYQDVKVVAWRRTYFGIRGKDDRDCDMKAKIYNSRDVLKLASEKDAPEDINLDYSEFFGGDNEFQRSPFDGSETRIMFSNESPNYDTLATNEIPKKDIPEEGKTEIYIVSVLEENDINDSHAYPFLDRNEALKKMESEYRSWSDKKEGIEYFREKETHIFAFSGDDAITIDLETHTL